MAKVITFANNKGGVLKTSLTVNIAGVLSKAGKKVLVIDVDAQGNSYTSFGKNPDHVEWSIYDLLVGNPDLKNPHEAIVNVAPNLDMIVANEDMAYIELDILLNSENFSNIKFLVKNVVDKFRDEYDFIFLDTPPSFGIIAGNAYLATDEIVIPFHPELYVLRSLVSTVKAATKVMDKNKHLEIKAIVPVKYKSRTVVHRAMVESAKGFADSQNIKLTQTVIKETVKYTEVMMRESKPITLVDDLPEAQKEFKEAYIELAKELGYL